MTPTPDPPDDVVDLGALLRQARQARGWTIAEVAHRAGWFKPSTLAAYERGERRITVSGLCWLADIYEVPVTTLLPPGTGMEDGSLLSERIGNLPGAHRELLTALVDRMHRDTEIRRSERG